MTTLDVPYGYVSGRYVLVIGDTSDDEDVYPDAVPAEGKVTFTPVAVTETYPELDDSITAIPQPVVSDIGADGIILDRAGKPGVWLLCGFYMVSFRFTGASIPAYRIHVTPEHTVDNPLKLALAAPLIPSPVEKFIVNEQVYIDTLAARDEAHDLAEAATLAAQSLGILNASDPIPTGWASRIVLREGL
jgi:hypothetical protein